MGIHDGPELNRPYFEFTIDPDREPFPLSRYKVSDETYVSFEIWSDGSVLVTPVLLLQLGVLLLPP